MNSGRSADIIWLAWFNHRRSHEIADAMGCEYRVIEASGPRGVKHIKASIKTVGVLWKNRRKIIFIQNPSRVLAAMACLFKLLFKSVVVVDRHTNFRLGKGWTIDPREIFAIACSEFSLRVADLTIVTNDYLRRVVDSKGGKGFVLPDKIPDLQSSSELVLKYETINEGYPDTDMILFICTYADDEPYLEVIEAASYLASTTCVYITGNYRKDSRLLENDLPSNVILTGFIPDDEFENLLSHADVVLDFTSLEWCLVCGGYEAMACSKPFVTSDTKALRDFYEDAAIFSKHEPREIARSIQDALHSREDLEVRISHLSAKRSKEWDTQFSRLLEEIERFHRENILRSE